MLLDEAEVKCRPRTEVVRGDLQRACEQAEVKCRRREVVRADLQRVREQDRVWIKRSHEMLQKRRWLQARVTKIKVRVILLRNPKRMQIHRRVSQSRNLNQNSNSAATFTAKTLAATPGKGKKKRKRTGDECVSEKNYCTNRNKWEKRTWTKMKSL